jgi:hypothetical protein
MRIRCLGNVFTEPFPSSCRLLLLRICRLAVYVVRCLFRSCYLETNVSEPFASNGCFSGSTVFALNKYGTV